MKPPDRQRMFLFQGLHRASLMSVHPLLRDQNPKKFPQKQTGRGLKPRPVTSITGEVYFFAEMFAFAAFIGALPATHAAQKPPFIFTGAAIAVDLRIFFAGAATAALPSRLDRARTAITSVFKAAYLTHRIRYCNTDLTVIPVSTEAHRFQETTASVCLVSNRSSRR